MRLQIVHINSESGSEAYFDMFQQTIERVRRPDTEVFHRWANLRRATDIVYPYPYMINTVSIIHHFVEAAENDGIDGGMVGCTGDPGITEARSLTSIPIVGPMEATLHLASMYSYKFGVVTVLEQEWREYCHSLVVRNGLWDRCAGLEGIDLSSAEAFTRGFVDPDYVVAEIDKKARLLADRGATAIVIGSAGLSAIASHAGYTSIPSLEIPVFDALTVGLKTLEMRVDLTANAGIPPVGRGGLFSRLTASDVARVRSQCAL